MAAFFDTQHLTADSLGARDAALVLGLPAAIVKVNAAMELALAGGGAR